MLANQLVPRVVQAVALPMVANLRGQCARVGLFAGDGGYHINAGSVQLKGGAIASTADKEHNTLSTNSFAASDITNASSFEASSVNLGAGYGSGAGQGPSFNPALPQHASGSSTTSTQATLTEGNIVINGTSTTAQALGVNTDASSAHQKTQELPGLQALQAKQQAVAQATATIAGAVQTFSQNQAKEAQKAQEAAQTEFEQTLKNSNPEGYAAYQKLDDSSKQNILLADSKYAEAYNAARDWGLGGSNSRLLNAATTLVTGVLGGQTNLQVAANTVAPYAAQAIGQAVGHGDNKNEAAQAVGHMLLGAALAYANHANPVAGGVAAVAAEKAADYLAQHYNDGKTALDPVTGQFNANLLPEEVKQEIKALTGIAASLAGAVGTGSDFNAQVAGVVGQNAVENNNVLLAQLWKIEKFVKTVPEDAKQYSIGGVDFYAPPFANFVEVFNKGKSISSPEYLKSPSDPLGLTFAVAHFNEMDNDVGHLGRFDFQRNYNDKAFISQYTNSANFAVGVYLAGAGYSLESALAIAGGFAKMFSSNAGDPNQVKFWTLGWEAARSGEIYKMRPVK